MNERVEIRVGDRVMFVEPKTAERVRKQQAINRERDRRISRDLKVSGLVPGFHTNQFAGWLGSIKPRSERSKDNLGTWREEKKDAIEQRFQAMCC